MSTKALLIQSQTTQNGGDQGEWNELKMATSYIQGIQTGDILETVNAQTLNALISGVPSPWARAKLFKYALETLNNSNPDIIPGGLLNFYTILHEEWRGLLATIALYPDRIRFSAPVSMDTTGGDYQIASAFGRMLFDDKDIWSNQEALATNPDEQPYLHLIYYRDQLVGGTSPLTGVFTGVNYSTLGDSASDINWYRNGRFEDPTRYLTPQQLQRVYLFIKNINNNAASFEQTINSQRNGKKAIDLAGFKGMARNWEQELAAQGNNLKNVGPVAQYSSLSQPFAALFNCSVPVYLKPDSTFTYVYADDSGYTAISNIQELLSTDNYVIGWAEPQSQRPKLSASPVYYLSVNDLQSGDTYYFSIPLSERGIDIFKNKLDTLLGYSGTGNTRLSGHLTDAGMLAVSLVVEIDGESVALNDREYHIHWNQNQGKVIAWPNFVSKEWDKYYLFTEYTDGDTEQFLPIYMIKNENEIIKTINGDFLTSKYKPTPEEQPTVDIKRLVTFPTSQSDNLPKYNILSSDKPMCGLSATVKITGKSVGAGFLMIRQDMIKDLTGVSLNEEAIVGIDFGSNNTCLFYNANDKGTKPIEFDNYRIVLVGRENNDKKAIAENNELLFFTNYPAENGQLKSWLHEHDSRYIVPNQSAEVAGGVPVNRPNVRVLEMDEFEIKTQAGTLHYNMKWLDNDKGREKKRAFLKSIWLQACAYLYTHRIQPQELLWSFPGSMMPADRDELERIYEDLCKITPFEKPNLSAPLTEAEAVCSYAMSQDFGLASNNMFLGIDVGGSTSDIHLIAKNPQNNNKPSLFRESSVRLAAGVFFDAVIKSEQFRQALVNFHESHDTPIHVENIKEILDHPDKAPYFLNNIFDQLKTQEQYDAFYDSLASNAKFVFTIPAYVCGLLLFYSGMLIGKAIKDNRLDNIDKIDLLPFGKGGRIFHWLRHATSTRTTTEFYRNCINSGLQLILPGKEVEVNYRNEIEHNNKTEVARGLCEQKGLAIVPNLNDTDICGETGVTYLKNGHTTTISPDEEICGEQFADDMSNFDFSGVQNFEKYMNLFIDFVSQRTNLYRKAEESLREDLSDLPTRIIPFCTSDPEYKKASRNNKNGLGFHYHQPIIIAEGACFLKALVRKAFNQ